ncbi:MAG: c-type cytochrome domain-containing protein [Gemmataceae bacterium]
MTSIVHHIFRRSIVAAIVSALICTSTLTAEPADPTYWQDVRPLLRKHCTVCHSEKNVKEVDVSGGLALDTYEVIRKGPKVGVIKPGNGKESRFIALLITDNASRRMPLDAPPLPPADIDLLRRWIDIGLPEGTKPTDDAPVVATAPVNLRKLDVVLSTTTNLPAGTLGAAQAGRLDLVLKVGPLSPVTAVAFSPDGKLLAAGSYGQVTIWDLATATPVKVLTNVLGAVNDLCFSPDGRLLVVAGGQPSARGDLRLYQVSDWKLLGLLGGHTDVVSYVAFSPDGQRLASASFDKTVRIWDVASHKLEQTLSGHSDFVYATAFSPDGKWLVSASKDRSVKKVDAASGAGLLTFSGMNEDVLAVAVRPDGQAVVSSGYEPDISWWDPATGERTRLQGGHRIAVHELQFSSDGKLLLSAGADGTMKLWDGASGALSRNIPVGSIVYAAALSPDNKLAAAGGFDGLVRLYEVASGRHLLTLLSLPPKDRNADWLALTPEGYTVSSDTLRQQGRWQAGAQTLPADAVWQTLRQPDAVAKAAKGETLTVPSFPK